MKKIKNLDNKTVCAIDREKQAVEIKVKDCKTVISFVDGKFVIKNTRIKGEKENGK